MPIKLPPFRKLRGYAFDPSLSMKIDTVGINNIVYKIPWEIVEPGPKGEYIEVVDYDPVLNVDYEPIDLNNQYILAQDGLDPSESNPQFHQQMVYAVAMTTITNFEKALGRKIIWSRNRGKDPKTGQWYDNYVQCLRIYPHALCEANAYYSPQKKALLFGYFSSQPADNTLHMPDSLVFTCLSHDIIAHETTHAILDSMFRNYNEPTNPDMLAFHEAFADIVALFQHFTFPEVLKNQIAKTRGDLNSQNLLGQLAQEFGVAIGHYGSLRDAIGGIDPVTNKWKAAVPNPVDYVTEMEPHARGSILVAAVFEAFISIYRSRVADLLRIASNGTGILQQGELHPDLVNRLAAEAAKSASHVLGMCVRALDYCPPVDLTFGDYLRAIITADTDLVADDHKDYRLAFIDAFRKRGIYPEGIKTLSVESLAFSKVQIRSMKSPSQATNNTDEVNAKKYDEETEEMLAIINKFLRDYKNEIQYIDNRKKINDTTVAYIQKDLGLHQRLNLKFRGSIDFEKITGLYWRHDNTLGIRTRDNSGDIKFEVQNLRAVSRVGPDGTLVNQVVFSIIQTAEVMKINDGNGFVPFVATNGNYAERIKFRGGCSLIFNLDTLTLDYAISKPIIETDSDAPLLNSKRLHTQCAFQGDGGGEAFNEFTRYFSDGSNNIKEPFAFLHRH